MVYAVLPEGQVGDRAADLSVAEGLLSCDEIVREGLVDAGSEGLPQGVRAQLAGQTKAIKDASEHSPRLNPGDGAVLAAAGPEDEGRRREVTGLGEPFQPLRECCLSSEVQQHDAAFELPLRVAPTDGHAVHEATELDYVADADGESFADAKPRREGDGDQGQFP